MPAAGLSFFFISISADQEIVSSPSALLLQLAAAGCIAVQVVPRATSFFFCRSRLSRGLKEPSSLATASDFVFAYCIFCIPGSQLGACWNF